MTSTLKSLRALSDPTRLRIVALLEKDELSVNELQEITRLGQSRISTHLGLLADCALVKSRRDGKRTFYRLNPQADSVASEFIQLAIRGAKELAEHAGDQINTVWLDRGVLEVAQPEFEIFQAVLFGLGRAEGDNFFRVIHRNDPFGPAGQQFAQQTFTGAQIGHHQRRQYSQQQMPEGLPRTARPVNTVETSRDLVKINLRLLAPARHHPLEVDLIVCVFRQFLGPANRELDELAH